MADSTGVLDELGSRRPRRTPPPPRPISGTPRQGPVVAADTAPAPAREAAQDAAKPDAAAAAPPPAVTAAAPVSVAPAPAPAPQPEPARERHINVHGRLPEGLFHRLDHFVREVERGGWGQTSKIEMIQLLVSELPDSPDEEFGQRLRAFRRAQAR